MRPVHKNFLRPPLGLNTNNLNEVLDLTDAEHKDKIRQSIYGNQLIVKKLKVIYTNKCAYCECYEPEPEVEHYRPKKRVTGVPGHPGYYWLCYEWSNLMPSCHDCNKAKSKGNNFPVENTGMNVSGPILVAGVIDLNENLLTSNELTVSEVPLLLNPELPDYDPFDYFDFDAFGIIMPKSEIGNLDKRKAEETIKCIRLNRDKLLLTVRKRNIRYFMKRIKLLLYRYLQNDISTEAYEQFFIDIIREIHQNSSLTKDSEYWFFWNYFRTKFKSLLPYYFKGRHVLIIIDTYNEVIGRV